MNITKRAVERLPGRWPVVTSLDAGLAWRVERGLLLIRSPAHHGDLPWRQACV